jgi:hypothetical protein
VDDIILNEISQSMGAGRLIPVVCAGISSATVKKMPSWSELIESAISYGEASGSQNTQEATRKLKEHNFLEAAELARIGLGNQFPLWLRLSFSIQRDQVDTRAVIDRICDLMPQFIATTNYDRLLTLLHPESWEPVTWTNADNMHAVLLEGRRVLHLHGVYDQPESVVFGSASYAALASSPAYDAVTRSLWLGHTLLFLGASIDGVSDPDFSRLLGWMATTFGASSFKHYALMRSGSFSREQQREFLAKFQLHLVEYGPQFEDLPRLLGELNPQSAKAKAWRINLGKDLIGEGSIERNTELANVFEGIRSNAGDLLPIAEELLRKRQHTSTYVRGQFVALQQLMSLCVDENEILRQMKRWQSRQITSFEADFAKAVIDADLALSLVPKDLLVNLSRRGVDINNSVLDGASARTLGGFKLGRGLFHDLYEIEEMARILMTTRSILKAQPESVFPEIARAVVHGSYSGTCLVVTRDDRLELRKLSRPEEVVVELPLSHSRRSSEIVEFHGRPTVITFDEGGLLAWQPTATDEPFAEFLVDEVHGVDGIANRTTPNGLQTFVTTKSGPVYELGDLKFRKKWIPLEEGFLQSPVVTPDGQVFGLRGNYEFELVSVNAGWVKQQQMLTKDLVAIVSKFPLLNKLLNDRLNQERNALQSIGEPFESSLDYVFGSVELSFCYLNMLVLKMRIGFIGRRGSAVFLLDPRTLEPAGYAYFEKEVFTDCQLVKGEDGTPRIFITLDADLSYDGVKWFKGVWTRQGWIFVPEGSTLRTKDGLMRLCMVDSFQGFAADYRGSLFHFSTKSGEFREFAKAEDSKVVDLALMG